MMKEITLKTKFEIPVFMTIMVFEYKDKVWS